jgi:L-lactate dehydrogenase
MKIYAGNYDDIKNASLVIITAGANQKPGETRLDLVKKNISIFKSIIPEIKKRNFNGILLIVANPVDILTTVALKLSGLPENRVIGSGTVLDTARLKYEIGNHLNVDSRSVHAFIIGEHGDSEIAAWSSVNISGVPLKKFCEMRGHCNHEERMKKIAEDVKNSAYEIIAKKKATYFGVAMAVKRICEAIVRDEKSILPISAILHGEYGINDVSLSMPAIVGKDGIETHVPIQLNESEIANLQKSAQTLKDTLTQNEL